MIAIDLNCDLGEMPASIRDGTDDALMACITSANVACGGHAGDAATMERTIRAALRHGIAIGAHQWTCIAGYGHAPEHMSLHCPDLGVLISGDMVLPRISTNVSVYDLEPEADPLPLYLVSIERLKALAHDTLVLPSHGLPFRGLHTRLDYLQHHHDERLSEAIDALAEPRTAHDLVPVLFRRQLDAHQLGFAIGETVAHLHYLEARGQAARLVGRDGIHRFRKA